MNFSLMLNSVGFYQISNLSMIPVMCVMEWVIYSKHYSREVKASVMVVVVEWVAADRVTLYGGPRASAVLNIPEARSFHHDAHTDCIVTEDTEVAELFLRQVDRDSMALQFACQQA